MRPGNIKDGHDPLTEPAQQAGSTSTASRLRWALIAAAVLLAGTSASAVRADGDPASDYLVTQNVYLPIETPSPAAAASLEQAVASVYEDGERIKVAVIYSATDLGAIPSLFGKPSDYAGFLGLELGYWYAGPLLIVMPAGFGIYDAGRSTQAEQQVLRTVPISSTTPDDLSRSAASAVQHMIAANTLHSPDIKAPIVTVYPPSATRGKTATLRFDLYDDSGHSKAAVRVYAVKKLLATFTVPDKFTVGTRQAAVHWRVPAKLPSRQLRFCVTATDPSGNKNAPMCTSFLQAK